MKNRRQASTLPHWHSKGQMRFLCLLLGCLLGGASQGGLYPLTKITNNGPGLTLDPYQFTVDVQNYSATQILLVFSNNNSSPPLTLPAVDSTIAGIYIDDTLISFNSFIGLQVGAIEFSDKGTGKLPGGGSYGFTRDDFYAGADNPAPKKGLNPGESVGLLFDLNSASYDDINTAIGNKTLWVGLHIISIQYGNSNVSESFTIPEPITLLLLGLGGFCTRSYRYNRRVAKTDSF